MKKMRKMSQLSKIGKLIKQSNLSNIAKMSKRGKLSKLSKICKLKIEPTFREQKSQCFSSQDFREIKFIEFVTWIFNPSHLLFSDCKNDNKFILVSLG
jgi:hypothetical protein